MTLEQFKEKVKAYEICHNSDASVYVDEHMQDLAHEIAMNAMDILKAVVGSGFREGHERAHPDSIYPSYEVLDQDPAWLGSDTKKRLDESELRSEEAVNVGWQDLEERYAQAVEELEQKMADAQVTVQPLVDALDEICNHPEGLDHYSKGIAREALAAYRKAMGVEG